MATKFTSNTLSHLMAGAIALFRGTFVPNPGVVEHAGYGRPFTPRWFRVIPQTMGDSRRSARRRFLDPLI